MLALVAIALLATLASLVLEDYGAAVAARGARRDAAQARLLARGAIDWARNVLADDARRSATDHEGEAWAVRVPPTPVEEGEVGGRLLDLSGRFDLNSLARGGAVDAVQLEAYARLLRHLGIPSAQADALAAALDAPLVDVDELRLVRGYDAEILERLRPFAAALPVAGRLNVNTASAEVLAAAVPGLGIEQARALIESRRAAPFKDVADFTARLPRGQAKPDPSRLAVSSRYFLASGIARYGEATTRVEVLLDRSRVWPDIVWQRIL